MDSILRYQSDIPLDECIQRIKNDPWVYSDKYGTALWYKCSVVSAEQLLITFTGGQFRKARRTQYLVDFASEGNRTVVVMRFKNELFGLHVAMTPSGEIDLFMNQKISAARLEK